MGRGLAKLSPRFRKLQPTPLSMSGADAEIDGRPAVYSSTNRTPVKRGHGPGLPESFGKVGAVPSILMHRLRLSNQSKVIDELVDVLPLIHAERAPLLIGCHE